MEYRFDGLRFDAVHAISDAGFPDEMARAIRATVEPGRHVHLVLEHEGNKASHLRTGPDAPGSTRNGPTTGITACMCC